MARPMTKTKLILNLTRGSAVCVAEIADGPLRRMRGLMGRQGLPAGEGLLIRPALAVHTAFMRFPIDALFLDRELTVLAIVEGLVPWRAAARRGARSVLELSAGEAARCKVETGDRMELRDRAEQRAQSSLATLASTYEAGLPAAADKGEAPAEQRLGALSGVAAAGPRVDLAGMAPLHVALLSTDRHFRTVIALLLARRNCSVSMSGGVGRLAELVELERLDVVVVDTRQPRAAASIEALESVWPRIGIVLVGDDAAAETEFGRPALARWGPFGELMAAIERAQRERAQESESYECA